MNKPELLIFVAMKRPAKQIQTTWRLLVVVSARLEVAAAVMEAAVVAAVHGNGRVVANGDVLLVMENGRMTMALHARQRIENAGIAAIWAILPKRRSAKSLRARDRPQMARNRRKPAQL